MTYRSRTRDLRVAQTGRVYYLGNWIYRTVYQGRKDTCYDFVNQWEDDNALTVIHDTRHVPLLNGVKYKTDGTIQTKFEEYPATWNPPPYQTLTYFPSPSTADLDAYALRNAALSNPNKPHVSVPTFIGELRDIPVMLKGWLHQLLQLGRRTIANQVANGLLSWKFGIRPFLGDLQKFATAAEAIQARLRYLRSLQDKGYVHRRVRLEHDEIYSPATSPTTVQSLGGTVSAYRDVAMTKDVWATSRWILDPTFVLPSNLRPDATRLRIPRGMVRVNLTDIPESRKGSMDLVDWVVENTPNFNPRLLLDEGPAAFWQNARDVKGLNFTLAQRLTYGFTAYEALATLWELTPWSWFIDWFSNVGDFIAAHRNTVPVILQRACLCRHLKSKTFYRLRPPPYSADWITVKGYPWTEEEERKERHILPNPSLAGLIPTLPFLTGGQLSILGSLTYLKETSRSGKNFIPRFTRLRR